MATYTLKKKFTFEAAHYLPNHDGKCQRLHGHSWIGWVVLEGEELQRKGPKQGMLVDYGDVSARLKPLVDEYLDHHHLNQSIPEMVNPTSENIAKWVYDQLSGTLRHLRAVEIEETCTSSCTYRPDDPQG